MLTTLLKTVFEYGASTLAEATKETKKAKEKLNEHEKKHFNEGYKCGMKEGIGWGIVGSAAVCLIGLGLYGAASNQSPAEQQ